MENNAKRQPPARKARSATVCNSPDCNRPILARGYCKHHYYRLIRGRNPDEPIREYGQDLIDLIIRRPPDRIAALDIEAEKLGVTRYEICRRVLDDWFEQWVKQNGPPSPGRVQALVMKKLASKKDK